MQAIEVNDIKKSYKNKYALGRKEPDTGISFAVPSGELFGIIGPDGAGKTSLFRILLVSEIGIMPSDEHFSSILRDKSVSMAKLRKFSRSRSAVFKILMFLS